MAALEGFFGPKELDVIQEAYRLAVQRLEADAAAAAVDKAEIQERVAQAVIDLAKRGDVSRERLVSGALERLGYAAAD